MQILDKKREFISVSLAILTVSDSRTLQNDKSGDYLLNSVLEAGHICKKRDIELYFNKREHRFSSSDLRNRVKDIK